jgi:hypothetical protein
MNLLILIPLPNLLQQHLLLHLLPIRVLLQKRHHAAIRTRLLLHTDVGLRVLAGAHEHDGEAWAGGGIGGEGGQFGG